MVNDIFATPLFGITLCIVVYLFSEYLIRRFEINNLPPIFISAVIIVCLILYSPDITYAKFNAGGQFISLFLGPATIALALPLYKKWVLVKDNAVAIGGGICFGTVLSIMVIFALAKLLDVSEPMMISMIPKSVTTPIAIEIAKTIGGIPPITTATVVMSGCFGAAFNHKLLAIFGVKNDLACGLAIGLSSHGIGTSACARVNLTQLAISGVAMGLTGIATSIVTPMLLPILQNLVK